jgi:hypothetical protein
MIRSNRVEEAWWLLAVDGLLKMTVKKGILHAQLVKRPCTGGGKTQHSPAV